MKITYDTQFRKAKKSKRIYRRRKVALWVEQECIVPRYPFFFCVCLCVFFFVFFSFYFVLFCLFFVVFKLFCLLVFNFVFILKKKGKNWMIYSADVWGCIFGQYAFFIIFYFVVFNLNVSFFSFFFCFLFVFFFCDMCGFVVEEKKKKEKRKKWKRGDFENFK